MASRSSSSSSDDSVDFILSDNVDGLFFFRDDHQEDANNQSATDNQPTMENRPIPAYVPAPPTATSLEIWKKWKSLENPSQGAISEYLGGITFMDCILRHIVEPNEEDRPQNMEWAEEANANMIRWGIGYELRALILDEGVRDFVLLQPQHRSSEYLNVFSNAFPPPTPKSSRKPRNPPIPRLEPPINALEIWTNWKALEEIQSNESDEELKVKSNSFHLS
ncbi:hypothetical protein NHQ30_007335 [Ciborinia camelliae]|nr:hypothetical protein NHQ30_007335 [Ciborinia camelliae]